MAATSNNSWPIPISTDYVKNGWDAINDLGVAIDTSTGTGLLAWQSYTPTLTGWGVGNGTWDIRYCKLGKSITISGVFTLGTTTTTATGFTFTLPAGLPARAALNAFGVAYADASTVNAYGFVTTPSTTTGTVVVANSSATYATGTNIATGVPSAWASGDKVAFTITYETA